MESAENQAQPQSDNESKVDNNLSLSKTETIALLNESIDRLEETISKISQDAANIPPSKSLDNLLATTQELEAAVMTTETKVTVTAKPPASESKQAVSPPIAAQPTTPGPAPQPKAKSQKNAGLMAIVVAVIAIAIVVVVWLVQPEQFANLLPIVESEPAQTEVVVPPSVETPKEDTIDTPADNLGIVSDTEAIDFPPEIGPVAEPVEDVVEIVIPQELTSSGRAKNLKMVAIKPKLNFTPEQSLVAVLETKISALTDAYPQNFVQSVLIDLPASSLLIRVTDDWYDLDESARNNLGNEILERSRAFRFQTLELRDNSGTLVARNPIIGDNIIVLPDTRK